jgi:hypothetical protein
MMTIQAIQPGKPPKKGGGGIGALIGGAIGGIGGFFAGGPGGALAGAKLGYDVGGGIGNKMNKPEGPSQSVVAPEVGNPMERKQQLLEQNQKINTLRDAAMATADLPPDQRQQYLDPIMKAAALLSPHNREEGIG